MDYCIGNGQVDQLRMSEKVGTLNCMHDQQAVLTTKERSVYSTSKVSHFMVAHENVAGSLMATDYKDPQIVVHGEPICIGNGQVNDAVSPSVGISKTLNCMDDPMKIMDNMVVRRLTPLECERLQGFPDGWTDIGEWTDSNGKSRKTTDSARYKALGNSIALPFWQRLARRITAQYDRDITMGSLFDGIGGFPYVFERCGAKAVWASEIEEFPIAVTKRRFQEQEEK